MSRLWGPAAAGLFLLCAVFGQGLAQGDAKRGLYISKAAGCLGCHTEAKEGAQAYAGGRELKTPFGTFYGPNITPHPQAGIGRWSEQDFLTALRTARRPDGSAIDPQMPVKMTKHMTDTELKALYAYLRTVPAKPYGVR